MQWAKPHDATKMPQLLCVKLEDPKKLTSQTLRRSRAVIHLNQPTIIEHSLGHGYNQGVPTCMLRNREGYFGVPAAA